MALRIEDELPLGRFIPADADYPDGSYKDETIPKVSNDGSPITARLKNSTQAFFQGLMIRAGITPSGVPDTVLVSDYLDALSAHSGRTILNIAALPTTAKDSSRVSVANFYVVSSGVNPEGSGDLIHDAGGSATTHDGVLIIDPTRDPETEVAAGTWWTGSGSGLGVYRAIVNGSVNAERSGIISFAVDPLFDNTNAINGAIDAAFFAGMSTVVLGRGKTYGIADIVKIRSNIILDLNGSTLLRIGTAKTKNLVQNFTYTPVSPDENVGCVNGRILGNVTDDTATQDHTAVAGNIFFFGVEKFLLRDLKIDKANSNGLGWREAHKGIVDNVEGGSYGGNLFAPTSGLDNKIMNSNFDFPGALGASPGECIDMENNSDTEISSTQWVNVTARGLTMVDFHTAAGNAYAHEATFEAFTCTGKGVRTFRIIALNSLKANKIVIGDSCKFYADAGASAFEVGFVDNVSCDAKLYNNESSAGTTKGIFISNDVDGLTCRGGVHSEVSFGSGVLTDTGKSLTNSKFFGGKLNSVTLGTASDGNEFRASDISSATIIGDGNELHNATVNALSLTGNANRLYSSQVTTLTIDGAGSINNTVDIATGVTNALVLTNGALRVNQNIEGGEGTFVPVLEGTSVAGVGTYTTQEGSYSIKGDLITINVNLRWTAHTGTGDLRVDISDILDLPADAITPSRWPLLLYMENVARTDDYVIAFISGGFSTIAIYQGAALNNIPMDTAGTMAISGVYKIR